MEPPEAKQFPLSNKQFYFQRSPVVFHSMKKVLSALALNTCTKLRLLKCYVWSTLLYGCESWTISKRIKSQWEAAEMFLRRMLCIAW